jgi:hypothetical protein
MKAAGRPTTVGPLTGLLKGQFPPDSWYQEHRQPPNSSAPGRRVVPFPTGIEEGAVLADQDDEWAKGRRYLGLDVLALAQAVPTDSDGEVSESTLQAITAYHPTMRD